MQIELINQYHYENLSVFKKNIVVRNCDAFVLVIKGGYSVLATGEKRPIVIGEHEIAFIPAGVEYYRTMTEASTYYYISFHSDAEHPFRRGLPMSKLILPKDQAIPIFNALERAFLIPDSRELITHLIERIFVENYLFGKSRTVDLPHVSEEVIDTVRYMNRNLNQRLDMEELAARVYLSHTGLIWKFKRELGTTPSQYLILLRLRYAAFV